MESAGSKCDIVLGPLRVLVGGWDVQTQTVVSAMRQSGGDYAMLYCCHCA